MENLLISEPRNGNEIFPKIQLNADTGICSISGDSYMQNTKSYFMPVLKWFDEYIHVKKNKLELICKLKSFNTGTSRVLFEILEKLSQFKQNGGKVYIQWYIDDQKDTLADDIVDIISELGISLKLNSY